MKLYQIHHSTDKRKRYIAAHSSVQAEDFAKEHNIPYDTLQELSEKDLDSKFIVEEFYQFGEVVDEESMSFREMMNDLSFVQLIEERANEYSSLSLD